MSRPGVAAPPGLGKTRGLSVSALGGRQSSERQKGGHECQPLAASDGLPGF